MPSFDINPYASTHPAIDSLFSREFAQRQGQVAAQEAERQRQVARDQIRAQERLAEAQLRDAQAQREYSNLFREREFQAREKGEAERNALLKRQLDIDEKWKVPRADLESERRKQAIIYDNANAINDAQRANALLQINIADAVAAAKKALPWGAGNLGGVTADNLDDPTHPARKAINKRAFDTVRTQLLAEKGGALNSLIPDPDTFTFKPVQFDSQGNVVSAPFKAPVGTSRDFDYMGNPVDPGVAAGLGTRENPIVMQPTVVTGNPSALGPTAQAIQTLVDRAMSSAADMFGIKAPAVAPAVTPGTPSLRRLVVVNGRETVVLLTPEDDAELQRQLIAIPAEQRPAAYKAIIGQLLQGRRAVLPTPQPTDPLDFRSLMN
jgi:hypothetical protein